MRRIQTALLLTGALALGACGGDDEPAAEPASEPAHSVRFHNISFAHTAVETATCFSGSCNGQSADFLQTAAIQLEHAHDWEFTSISIAHTGGNGIDFGIGTKGCTLQGSSLLDLGAGAVRLSHSSGVGQDKLSGLGCKTGREEVLFDKTPLALFQFSQ